MTAPQAPVRLRRTWPQRLLILFNVFCILAALTTAVGLTYVKQSVGGIPRIRLGTALQPATAGAAGKPQNYLVVGVDSAAGLASNDPVRIGRAALGGTLRSDTIMVLHIDPNLTTASILSFPRDLWTPIAGTGRSSRINSAIETADPNQGPARLIKTIEQDFQIPIDHYLQVDFAGFKGIVRAVGGLPVYFPTPVRDRNSGLNVPVAGCTTLDDAQALGFVRSRHYESFIGGKWREDPASDLGRISRQQDFIRRVIRRAISKGVRNPSTLTSLVATGVKSITLDENLTIGQLTDLGLRFRGFNPSTLQTYSLGEAVIGVYHGAASVLELVPSKADPILRRFQKTEPTGLSVGSITVKVLNGSGAQNQAASVTQALSALGFLTASPDSALSTSAETVVFYGPGHEKQAQLVARYLAAPVRFQVGFVSGIQIVTGTDFTTVRATAKPASAVPINTTTTTAPSNQPTSTAPSTTTTALGNVPSNPPGVSCG
jgi:LCP family protein required for cell wall assembly